MLTTGHSPYKGLMPFSETDAPFFFGRARDTRLVSANLSAAPLTLLYGDSGSGKSSILRAGVVPYLRKRTGVLTVFFNEWLRADSLLALKEAVAREARETGSFDDKALADFSLPLPDFLASVADGLGCRLMIILDDFQEYLVLRRDEDDAFAVELPWAVAQSHARVNFLISLRADALHMLDRFAGRIPSLFYNYLRVEHLDRDAALEAIVEPLRQYSMMYGADGEGFRIEPECVEEILDEVGKGNLVLDSDATGSRAAGKSARIEMSFLQMVLTRLWDAEMDVGSHELRLSTLKELGGASRIVRTHMDHALHGLNERERNVAAQIFKFLVTPSGVRVAYTLRDLSAYTNLPREELNSVVNKLSGAKARILRATAPLPGLPDSPRYEIFHDVLAPAMRDWNTNYAMQVQAEQARKKQRSQMLVRVLILLLLSLVVMTIMTLYAFRQQMLAKSALEEAEAQRREAEHARQRAEEALIELKHAEKLKEDAIRKSEGVR